VACNPVTTLPRENIPPGKARLVAINESLRNLLVLSITPD
jgi:hypothetical protein